MKVFFHLSFGILFLLLSNNLSSQENLNIEGDGTLSGRLGIGTAAIESKLHIAGGTDANLTGGSFLQLGFLDGENMAVDNNEIQVRNSSIGSTLFLQKDGGNLGLVRGGGYVGINTNAPNHLLDLGGSFGPKLAVYQNNAGTNFYGFGISTATLEIHAGSDGTEDPGMVVKNNGRVGIGNINPETVLHVSGGGDASVINGGGFIQLGDADQANIGIDNNEIMARDNGTEATLFIQKDGGNLSLNQAGGSVGIGTSSPQNKLHIVDGDDLTLTQGGFLQLGGAANLNMVFDQNEIQVRSDESAENLFIQKEGGKVVLGAAPIIGNYTLYVDQGILTERVKIATIGTNDWADYVFDSDYPLKSLTQIETFVKQNKHLPNIPSAEEVEKSGYELQEMDIKLLEKIEELYLLTIQLNSEKNSLEMQCETLQNKSDSIELKYTELLQRIEKLESH